MVTIGNQKKKKTTKNKSLSVGAQNKLTRVNYVKVKIDNALKNITFCISTSGNETMHHISSEYSEGKETGS